MRTHRPSWTARAVALSRALASGAGRAAVDPGDAAVRQLLPTSTRAALRVLEATGLARLSSRASLGLHDHVALRAAIIDRELTRAVAAGIDQLVILGAGLDTRAHRLQALRGCDVYELDFPSSQAEKRASARDLASLARSLSYVPIDFERDDVGARLASSSHRLSSRTAWLLEGVAPYLSRPALTRLLEQVGATSAPGSELVLTYIPDGTLWLRLGRPAIDALLRVAGEPLRSPLAPETARQLIEASGLRLVRDLAPDAWADALGVRSARHFADYERLALAQKD